MVALHREEMHAPLGIVGGRGGQSTGRGVLHPQGLAVAPPRNVTGLSPRVGDYFASQVVRVALVHRLRGRPHHQYRCYCGNRKARGLLSETPDDAICMTLQILYRIPEPLAYSMRPPSLYDSWLSG